MIKEYSTVGSTVLDYVVSQSGEAEDNLHRVGCHTRATGGELSVAPSLFTSVASAGPAASTKCCVVAPLAVAPPAVAPRAVRLPARAVVPLAVPWEE